jgi:anti-sigma B factor antagonist
MQIASESKDKITVVRFEGNLDTNTSAEAQDYLNREIDNGAAKVVVNFDKVDFVSSAGLRVLLMTAKKLGVAGGSLRVCGLNETVSEVFEISGFSTILNVFKSQSEALAGF